MKYYKRHSFLTEKKYQLKFTSVIILSMLIVATVIAATTYWDISSALTIQSAKELMQWDKYIVRVVLLLIAAFLAGIFLSHKIIGPIYRLEDFVKRLNEGKFEQKLNLRSGDEFMNLANQLNELSVRLDEFSKTDPNFKENFKKNKFSS